VETYYYVANITDVGVRATCYARLLSTLARVDRVRKLEHHHQLHSAAEADFGSDVKELLAATADHAEVFEDMLRALAPARLELGVTVAESLNTEPRRDRALAQIIDAGASASTCPEGASRLLALLSKLVDPARRDEAILRTLKVLSRRTTPDDRIAKAVLPCLELVKAMDDPGDRCRALCRFYLILLRHGGADHADLANSVLTRLKQGIPAIDIAWERVRVAFEAAALVAKESVSAARDLLAVAESCKNESTLQTETAAKAYVGAVILAISAYSGLLPRSAAGPADLERLRQLIDDVPSDGERARLWADLALRAFAKGQRDACRTMVANHLRPLLQNLEERGPAYRQTIVSAVAPALHCAHALTGREEVKRLPSYLRDGAVSAIVQFMLRKRSFHEPYEHKGGDGYRLSWEEASEVCEVAELASRDDVLYWSIAAIGDSLANSRYRDAFSQQQRADIATKLEALAARFPNPRFIRHDGYAVCALAQVAKIRRAGQDIWNGLVARARALPNISDQVFVLGTLAGAMVAKERGTSRQLLQEAFRLCERIPAVYDRAERLEFLGKTGWDVDPSECRRMLGEAMRLSSGSDENRWLTIERDVLDFAYKVDPDWAASLLTAARSMHRWSPL
jgi:hypothetical protein